MQKLFFKKNLKKQQILFFLLFFIFLLHFVFRIYQFRENYLIPFDASYWEERYNQSQWVVPNSKNGIGDDGLYTYAGYKYVFEGLNPILNSPEVPPLGKYLVGFSIFFFQNQNIFGVLTAVLSLVLLFLLNLKLFKNIILAFLPVLFFSFEPLFWQQMQAPFLDLLQLSFLLAVFLSVLKKKYVISCILLGFFSATKFPYLSVLVFGTIIVFLFLTQRSEIKKLLYAVIFWPLAYMFSYMQFFLLGNNVVDFAKVVKYGLAFYTSGVKSYNHMMFPLMIFTGRWYTWWGGVEKIAEWSLAWPLAFLISLGVVRHKKIGGMLLIALWSLFYVLFLFIVPVYPRYLLLLLPFLYNLSVWVLFENTPVKSYFHSS